MSFFCQHRITSLFILLWPHYTVMFNHFQSNSFIIIKKQSFSFIYASNSLSDFIHIRRGSHVASPQAAGRKTMPHEPVGYIPHCSRQAVQGSLYRGAGRRRRSERLKSVPYAQGHRPWIICRLAAIHSSFVVIEKKLPHSDSFFRCRGDPWGARVRPPPTTNDLR